MWVERHIISALLVYHTFQREPWRKLKLGQYGNQEHYGLQDGQGRDFYCMVSMVRTPQK